MNVFAESPLIGLISIPVLSRRRAGFGSYYHTQQLFLIRTAGRAEHIIRHGRTKIVVHLKTSQLEIGKPGMKCLGCN
jgi:hypothetical protein